MAISLTSADGTPLSSRDVDANGINFNYVFGLCAVTGSYTTGGDPSLQTALNAITDKLGSSIYVQMDVWSTKTTGAVYTVTGITPGTALSAGAAKLQVGDTASGYGTQVGAGAYPADILADVAVFSLVMRKLL